MRTGLPFLGIALASSFLACGGKAVIDGSAGSGGSGGTNSSSNGSNGPNGSNGSTGSSGVGPVGVGPGSGAGGSAIDCGVLTADLRAALRDAVACDVCDPVPDPCEYLSGVELTDECGCPIAVNSSNMDAVQEAIELHQTWKSLGCGPLDCDAPCAVSSDPVCTPAAASGCPGTCE